MDKPFSDLSKGELLELARQLAQAAQADDRPAVLHDVSTAKDPLVRSLAALGLRDLRKEFSYRKIASMFGVSHSRIHQLEQDLEGRLSEFIEKAAEKSKSA